ncbi:MAG: porin [Rickettsiales bacterium]|jgi:hypothetical protein|nr:porin [Rickettsiales bacterium]
MRFVKSLLPFFLLVSYAFADMGARSNHSYQALGFTRLPNVSFSGYIDGMGARAIQNKEYSSEIIEGAYTIDCSANPCVSATEDIKNKLSSNIPLYFAMDSMLTVEIMGVNDFGLKYGAIVDLNANTTRSSYNRTMNASSSFLYGEFIFGKIEFGSVNGASSKLKIDAGTLTKGRRSGINGRYLSFVNLPSIGVDATDPFATDPLFILAPQHPTGHSGFGIGYNNILYWCGNESGKVDAKCANNYITNNGWNGEWTPELDRMDNSLKISYYTPEIYGVQAGFSFTPDTGNRGAGAWNTTSLDSGDIDNVIEYGITYTGSYYGVGLSLGFTGQIGKSEFKDSNYKPLRNNLNSMQFGGILTFYGLSVGGSMGKWGSSLQELKNKDLYEIEGEYTTIGISYEFGPLYLSGTMIDSTFQDNKYQATSLNVDYKLSKSFYPYVEVTQFKFTPSEKFSAVKTNKGIVVIAGFVLEF